MKKIYLSIFLFSCSFGLVAQKARPSIVENRSDFRIEKSKKPVKDENISKITIWENDFSNSSEWSFSNITNDAQNWVISTSISTSLGFGTGAFVDQAGSVSNENGYALFDSDALGTSGGLQDALMTYTGSFNCSAYANVVLEFNQRIRMWTTTETIFEISNDGVVWIPFPVNLEKPNSSLYEEKGRVNISSAAGGQSNVKIRLRYKGSWDYAWLVDDLKIIEQPLNDIQSLPSYFAGTNNEGIEYGRTPIDQLDDSYDIGGSVYNFGVNDQSNVQVTANFGSLSYNYPIGNVLSGDTVSYGATENPALVIGQYDGTYTVTSDAETSSGPEFYNNVSNRSFKITSDVYSQDGIGVNPTADQSTSSLGSDSFENPTDTYLASMFHLKKSVNQISGFEIGLSTASVAGGQLLISIVDTATFFGDLTTPIVDINGNQVLSNYYDLAASEIAAGVVKVPFLNVIELPAGAYYAVVKPENTNNSPMRILDDQTVLQPWYASMVNTLSDAGAPTSYSNGNAFAIRLLMGDQLGVSENAINENFKVYPNPANASTTVSVEVANASDVAITIADLAGKVVYTNYLGTVKGTQKVNVNTEALNSGVYMVNVSVNETVSTQKLVVRK
ncbi:MAG: T9SS type A sorting domain-containing protein [Flavobacteriia bacterium]|jgi:hypothetical protein